MVVTLDVPIESIGVMQERVAFPSMGTVHAPHSALPQPNFVPVMPSTSRSTHNSGVSPSTSAARLTPLTSISKAMSHLPRRTDDPRRASEDRESALRGRPRIVHPCAGLTVLMLQHALNKGPEN